MSVPGTLALRASATRAAADADSSGFVLLTRAGETRRIAYWLHVSAHTLSREPHVLLRGSGTYHGNTKRGRSGAVGGARAWRERGAGSCDGDGDGLALEARTVLVARHHDDV